MHQYRVELMLKILNGIDEKNMHKSYEVQLNGRSKAQW